MRVDGALFYTLGDHLGSTSITVNASGAKVAEMRYKAWGEVRYSSGDTHTDKTYTGQRSFTDDFGLMYYNARWYDSTTGRFAQADNIELKVGDNQSLDRFAYATNNPIMHTDPTGHDVWDDISQFTQGAVLEVIRSIAWMAPAKVQAAAGPHAYESNAMLAGRVVGAIVSMVIGTAMVVDGTGIAGGGAAAACAGTACTLAPAAVGVGVAVAGYGALVDAKAVMGAAESLVMLAKRAGQSGDSSGDSSLPSSQEELVQESTLHDKKAPTYYNDRTNPFDIFKNSVDEYGPHPNPKYPDGYMGSNGIGYRPTSKRSGFATIDFPGGVKVKFPNAIIAK